MIKTPLRFMSIFFVVFFSILFIGCGDSQRNFAGRDGERSNDTMLTGPNGYPYCTNGSNTGGGYGWDLAVTDPKGSHSCLVAPTGPNGYPYCTNGSNTGGGYGWDPSVTDPKGSHSCLVPTSTPPGTGDASGQTGGSQLPSLAVGVPGNASFSIGNYGSVLQTNKQALVTAIRDAGATAQEQAVVIAIAMQETTYMKPSERDSHKDGTPSANVSILNLNYDMLTKLGYTGKDWGVSLNTPSQLKVVIGYLLRGFRTWGFERTLNYIRGGSVAFNDGVSYGAAGYRNAIVTIYKQIVADLTFQTDGRRVQIVVPGV